MTNILSIYDDHILYTCASSQTTIICDIISVNNDSVDIWLNGQPKNIYTACMCVCDHRVLSKGC
jgi:hypothetical protein